MPGGQRLNEQESRAYSFLEIAVAVVLVGFMWWVAIPALIALQGVD